MNNLRQCYVDGRKALFHGFREYSYSHMTTLAQIRHGSNIFAVVEFEDGIVKDNVLPRNVRFVDSSEQFESYYWPTTEDFE